MQTVPAAFMSWRRGRPLHVRPEHSAHRSEACGQMCAHGVLSVHAPRNMYGAAEAGAEG